MVNNDVEQDYDVSVVDLTNRTEQELKLKINEFHNFFIDCVLVLKRVLLKACYIILIC